MVFFTCNSCGQSIKKNQVEKHYTIQCRSCEVLSCMDCNKEFRGDEYKNHTKCITEEEKYSGQDYKPKPGARKGEKKQEEWIETIRKAAAKSNDDVELKNLLDKLVTFDNIPRKQKKFVNFLKNSVSGMNPRVLEKAWTIFNDAMNIQKLNSSIKLENTNKAVDSNGSIESKPKEKKKKRKHEAGNDLEPEKLNVSTKEENGKETNGSESKLNGKLSKNKKRKLEADTDDKPKEVAKKNKKQSEENNGSKLSNELSKETKQEIKNEALAKFNWRKVAKSILLQTSEKTMPLKKLKKKIIAEYKIWCQSETFDKNEICDRIEAKLFKQKFQLENDTVKLLM